MTNPKQEPQRIFYDPGFLFNTGYLGTFGSLLSVLGPAPLVIMAINWAIGTVMLAGKNSGKSGFFARRNAVLVLNGLFLIVTAFAVISLAFYSPAALLTGPVTFSAILAIGFGIGNIKKADELDLVVTGLLKPLPFLTKIKSEVLTALSSLCACLMTGGWSLVTAPFIFYAFKLGEHKAQKPESMAYRFTRWLATSPRSPVTKAAKAKLYRQHPLTIARAMLGYALLLSILVGVITIIGRSLDAGTLSLKAFDLAALGNLFHALATYRLYKMTDAACGDLPKD